MQKSKKLTVAFLYNVRHHYPDPDNSRTLLEADFYDPPVITAMIKNFKACGFKVIPIEAGAKAYFSLYKHRDQIDIAFNDSEGIFGQDREAQIPAMLEMLQIPYTGPGPLTEALVLNKAKAKEILLANKISTLPFQVFKTGNEKLSRDLNFPLIVKPVAQGSSAGITNKSIVSNLRQLRKQQKWVIKLFNQPALVEPFLTGREFSVAMLGNPPKILPIVESDHTLLPKGYQPLDSLEVKWLYEEQSSTNHLRCPAKMDIRLKTEIEKICQSTWKVLDLKDYTRLDLRCDTKDNPYVLEINSPAGLIPPEISTTSYFPLAARVAGITYQNLQKEIIRIALRRYQPLGLKRG